MSPGPFVGVDVGGTKVAAAVVEGTVARDMVERPTDVDNAGELLDGIEATVRELVERTGTPEAIGLGVPSMIEFATGRVLSSVNIPLQGVPLREELEGRFGVPVFVDNDGNCAALAEAQLVDDAPARSLAMLTLGTGVGGGLVLGGHIFRGSSGLAPELGHIVVQSDGHECPGACPNRGCLEAYCSGQALERDATELARRRPDSRLGRAAADGRVSGREVVAAAREGDPDALELMEAFGRWLGIGISNLVNVFEPQYVTIGGGLSRVGDLFLDAALAEAGARALPPIWERAQVTLGRGLADAGVVGAGLLAAQELRR